MSDLDDEDFAIRAHYLQKILELEAYHAAGTAEIEERAEQAYRMLEARKDKEIVELNLECVKAKNYMVELSASVTQLSTKNAELKARIAENATLKQRIADAEKQEPFGWLYCEIGKMPDFHYKNNGVHNRMIPIYSAPTTAMLDKVRDEENEACAVICDVAEMNGKGANYAAREIRARRPK